MMKELVPDRRVIPGLEWMEEGVPPRLSPDSLVYVGLRDIDKVGFCEMLRFMWVVFLILLFPG
jgi:hypothetical protein